jgi:ABC-type dipeptide/oligopeptide/nickel transport system permease subunit
MLDEGRAFLLQAPILALAPGTIIILTVASLNIFCDSIMQHIEKKNRR